jgi:hypothetical protein
VKWHVCEMIVCGITVKWDVIEMIVD